MEIVGRDKITQTGNKSSIKVTTKIGGGKHGYQKGWVRFILGISTLVIGTVMGTLALKYLGLV